MGNNQFIMFYFQHIFFYLLTYKIYLFKINFEICFSCESILKEKMVHTTASPWLYILFSNFCQEELHLKWEDWQKSAWCIQHLMSGRVNCRHRAYAVPCEIPSPAHYDYSPSCSSAFPLFGQAHRIYQSKALTAQEKEACPPPKGLPALRRPGSPHCQGSGTPQLRHIHLCAL